jgi:hypothetical protein
MLIPQAREKHLLLFNIKKQILRRSASQNDTAA